MRFSPPCFDEFSRIHLLRVSSLRIVGATTIGRYTSWWLLSHSRSATKSFVLGAKRTRCRTLLVHRATTMRVTVHNVTVILRYSFKEIKECADDREASPKYMLIYRVLSARISHVLKQSREKLYDDHLQQLHVCAAVRIDFSRSRPTRGVVKASKFAFAPNLTFSLSRSAQHTINRSRCVNTTCKYR